jgi:putative oxidoreductase
MNATTRSAFLPRLPDPLVGAALLRIALGTMWLAHAALKYLVFTIPGFAAWLAGQGLPASMAWPVFVAEVIGGSAILVGFHGRWASLLLLPVLAVAASTHVANGWVHTSAGGGWEYPVFLIVASVVHVLIGDGRFAIRSARVSA